MSSQYPRRQEPLALNLPNNSALAANLRVRLSAGYLVAAGATEDEIGRTAQAVGSGDATAPVLHDGPGSRGMVAAGAITQYADVYRAAGGKVSATPSGRAYGIALTDASNNNDPVEVLPYGPAYVA